VASLDGAGLAERLRTGNKANKKKRREKIEIVGQAARRVTLQRSFSDAAAWHDSSQKARATAASGVCPLATNVQTITHRLAS